MTPWKVYAKSSIASKYSPGSSSSMSGERILDDFTGRAAYESAQIASQSCENRSGGIPHRCPSTNHEIKHRPTRQLAGYSFHLGTPDELLRRIASWLITGAGEDQRVL